ncbi:MAG: hypothetical protein V7L11_28790 [Nostoc sp.]
MGNAYLISGDVYEMAGGVRYSDRIRKIRSSRLKNVAEQAADENTKTA